MTAQHWSEPIYSELKRCWDSASVQSKISISHKLKDDVTNPPCPLQNSYYFLNSISQTSHDQFRWLMGLSLQCFYNFQQIKNLLSDFYYFVHKSTIVIVRICFQPISYSFYCVRFVFSERSHMYYRKDSFLTNRRKSFIFSQSEIIMPMFTQRSELLVVNALTIFILFDCLFSREKFPHIVDPMIKYSLKQKPRLSRTRDLKNLSGWEYLHFRCLYPPWLFMGLGIRKKNFNNFEGYQGKYSVSQHKT